MFVLNFIVFIINSVSIYSVQNNFNNSNITFTERFYPIIADIIYHWKNNHVKIYVKKCNMV